MCFYRITAARVWFSETHLVYPHRVWKGFVGVIVRLVGVCHKVVKWSISTFHSFCWIATWSANIVNDLKTILFLHELVHKFCIVMCSWTCPGIDVSMWGCWVIFIDKSASFYPLSWGPGFCQVWGVKVEQPWCCLYVREKRTVAFLTNLGNVEHH